MNNQQPGFQPPPGPPGPQEWIAGPPQPEPPKKGHAGVKITGIVTGGVVAVAIVIAAFSGGETRSEAPAKPAPAATSQAPTPPEPQQEPASHSTTVEVVDLLSAGTGCTFTTTDDQLWLSEDCAAAVVDTTGFSNDLVLQVMQEAGFPVGTEYLLGDGWVFVSIVPGDVDYANDLLLGGAGETGVL